MVVTEAFALAMSLMVFSTIGLAWIIGLGLAWL